MSASGIAGIITAVASLIAAVTALVKAVKAGNTASATSDRLDAHVQSAGKESASG